MGIGSISPFSEEVIEYIVANQDNNHHDLMLKDSPFSEVSMKTIALQIQGRTIAKTKFPFLLSFHQYRYPQKVSLEQASSEITARFKAELIRGRSFADLTGGMGIDTFILGQNFEHCTYVESNSDLFKTTTFNFETIGFSNCSSFFGTCETFLQDCTDRVDWAYIDPSRRLNGQRKTSIFNYSPNIVTIKNDLLRCAEKVLLKLSPMQDISECIEVLEHVEHVWILSVKNEVKELLLQLGQQKTVDPLISAIDISKNHRWQFDSSFETRFGAVEQDNLKAYIYQPISSITKGALQDKYAESFALSKLHTNTQLFTSDELFEGFMGRIFKVQGNGIINKKNVRKLLPEMKANIISKNYPMTPEQIASKLKIKEGGNLFLIAFTGSLNQKSMIICERIK